MGVTRELAPVLMTVSSFQLVESNGRDSLQHHAIRATRTAFPYKELVTRGPFHFIAGGVLF